MEVSSHALAMGRVGGVRFARRRLHQLRPGPPGLPRRRRRLLRGQGPAVRRPLRASRCSTSTTRRCARWSGRPRSPTPPPVTRPPPGGPATIAGDGYAQRFTAHGPDGGGGRGRAWRCPAGTTSPTRCWPSPRWSRSGWTRRSRRPGRRRLPGRARPAGAGQRARPGARRGRLRAQAGRDRRGAGRAARARRRAAAG